MNAADLRADLIAHAGDLAAYLLGDPNRRASSKRELRFGARGSLSVVIAGRRAGLWHDYETKEGGDLLALVMREQGCSFPEAVDIAATFIGFPAMSAPPPRNQGRSPHRDDDDRRENVTAAGRLWREAQDPHGTVVESYLAARGLLIPAEAAGTAIRFHRACPFKGQRVPAMIALVRDVISNEPCAIHRTALTTDGSKTEIDGASRLSLGPVGGGAVKLTADEDVTTCLGIGEGIETTLSLRLVAEFGPSPIWALLSAGQVAALPVLPGIECLWIAVDRDEAGENAADEVAQRWRAAGREVFRVRPKLARTDLNDLARLV